MQTEAIGVAVGPFKVVHQTPQEIALHWYPVGRRSLELRQIVAQIHYAIRVIDDAVRRWNIRGRAAILSNVNLFHIPNLRDMMWSPVESLRADGQPPRRHVRIRLRMLYDAEAKLRLVCSNIGRRVDVDTDKVERTRDSLQVLGREFRRIRPGRCQVSVRVLAFLNHSHVRRVELTRGAGCRVNVVRRLNDGDADRHVLGQSNFGARFRLRSDRLHSQAMAQHCVMPSLVETARRQLQPGGMDTNAVSKFNESSEFVDRKEMLHPIREMSSNVACIIAEGFRRIA